MLSTFLEKAESLLNRSFVVAYWIPTFIVTVLGLLPRILVIGLRPSMAKWRNLVVTIGDVQDNSAQLWVTLLFLLGITLIAYGMQTFSRPILRLLEGYGKVWFPWLRKRRIAKQKTRMAKLENEARNGTDYLRSLAQDQLTYQYPLPDNPFDPTKSLILMPTRLGNTLKSAECYGLATYGMDMPFWWPKLWPLLPEGEQKAVTDALMGMMALITMGVLLLYNSFDSAIYLLRCQDGWNMLWALLPFVASWVLAWFCYEGAIVRARSYGQRVRAGVDLHRFDLLKTLRQPLPKTPLEERDLWKWLTNWAYSGAAGPAFNKPYDHGDDAPKEKEKAPAKEPTWLDKLFEWLEKLLK